MHCVWREIICDCCYSRKVASDFAFQAFATGVAVLAIPGTWVSTTMPCSCNLMSLTVVAI